MDAKKEEEEEKIREKNEGRNSSTFLLFEWNQKPKPWKNEMKSKARGHCIHLSMRSIYPIRSIDGANGRSNMMGSTPHASYTLTFIIHVSARGSKGQRSGHPNRRAPTAGRQPPVPGRRCPAAAARR